MEYVVWLAIFAWLPLAVLWAGFFKLLIRYKGTLTACVVAALMFSIPWDYWATATRIWNYPDGRNIGFWILGVPLETWLFIISITLLISSITIVLKYKVMRFM
jgi:lycopene cyclase domain-containing protein